MNEDAQELLMMFIKDGYSRSGKVSKKTALRMFNFVNTNKELANHVNSGDWKNVLSHKLNSDNRALEALKTIAKTNPHLFKTQEGMFNELQGIANLSNNILNEIN